MNWIIKFSVSIVFVVTARIICKEINIDFNRVSIATGFAAGLIFKNIENFLNKPR